MVVTVCYALFSVTCFVKEWPQGSQGLRDTAGLGLALWRMLVWMRETDRVIQQLACEAAQRFPDARLC